MKLTVSNIDFSSLLKIDPIVNNLQPDIKLAELNSYLFFDKGKEKLFFLIRGPLTASCMEISATLEGDTSGAVMVFSGNITHLINSYTDELQKNITLTITIIGDKSTLTFTGNNDKVQFPHLSVGEANLKELEDLVDRVLYSGVEPPILDYTFTKDTGVNFLEALSSCLSFVDNDLRNNAVAIYQDKLIASDSRHVYIQKLISNLNLIEGPIFLHRKIATVLIDLKSKTDNVYFVYCADNMVILKAPTLKFSALLNNKMARIAPPSEDDLASIRPVTAIADIPKAIFSDLLNFFVGFYSNKINYKVLSLKTQSDGINFILKNSGVIGYNSSHVERKLLTVVNGGDIACSVLFDSMRLFVKELSKEDTVSLFMDNEHKAVVLSSNRQEVYIAKPPK